MRTTTTTRIVEDYDYDAVGGARRYLVSFDGREPFPFSVEQLDFTEEAPRQLDFTEEAPRQ